MKKIKFQIQFVKEFLLSKNILLLDNEYTNNRTPLNLQCKCCNHIWQNRFNNIRNSNQGCPKCSIQKLSDKLKLSIENVKIKCLRHNITVLDNEYINAHTKILCKCNICNHEWNPTYSNISQGKGCPSCQKINQSKNKRLSQSEVKEFLNLKNIELLDVYIDSKTPILCKCNKCDYVWKSGGLNYIKTFNATCQNCNNQKLLSERICRYIFEFVFKEKFIKTHIDVNGVGGGKLELDGYCEKLNLAFEHNGPQHYKPKIYGVKTKENIQKKFLIQIQNDQIKKEWCNKNGITLIVIKELGKYTKEKDLHHIIKTQCPSNLLPVEFNNIQFDFKKIRKELK